MQKVILQVFFLYLPSDFAMSASKLDTRVGDNSGSWSSEEVVASTCIVFNELPMTLVVFP